MRKYIRRWYIPVIVLIVLIICCYNASAILDFFIPPSSYEVGVGTSLGEGHYQIDSETILTSIDNGEANIFEPREATPETTSWETDSPVQWGQADYLRVAEAFQEFVWDESLEGWNIEIITFRLHCEDVNSGPQMASFVLSKRVIENTGQAARIERLIYISPNRNSIYWYSSRTFPNHRLFQAIDLKKHTVLVDDALRIAEENGGKDARAEVNDDCIIDLHLHSSQKQEDNWHVSYSSTTVNEPFLLMMDIDPITGEFE